MRIGIGIGDIAVEGDADAVERTRAFLLTLTRAGA